MEEFVNIKEVLVGNTRGDRAIDRMFCNFQSGLVESGTVPPLETEGDEEVRRSDHRIAFFKTELRHKKAFEWLQYSYWHCTEEAEKEFREWVVMHDWGDVVNACGSNAKTDIYQKTVAWAVEKFFPLKTTKRKSTDLPWINRKIKKRIRRRMKIYKKQGRSALWKKMKKDTDRLIAERREVYMSNQRIHLMAPDAARSFFRNVKAFSTPEKPQQFDVRSLRPDNTK